MNEDKGIHVSMDSDSEHPGIEADRSAADAPYAAAPSEGAAPDPYPTPTEPEALRPAAAGAGIDSPTDPETLGPAAAGVGIDSPTEPAAAAPTPGGPGHGREEPTRVFAAAPPSPAERLGGGGASALSHGPSYPGPGVPPWP